MRRSLFVMVGLLASACARGYEIGPVSAPAPSGALDCATAFMGRARYTPVSGGAAAGFTRFEQMGRHVTVTVAGGVMRVVASPDREAQADARSLLAACAART